MVKNVTLGSMIRNEKSRNEFTDGDCSLQGRFTAQECYSEGTSTSTRYRRLKNDYEDNGYFEKQFERSSPKVPYKALSLATVLFLAGVCAIIFSVLTITGHVGAKVNDGTYVLLVLGLVMFIPGYYHIRIAYYAFKEYPGYSFDDIPDFD